MAGCRHLLWALVLAWFGHLPGDIRIEREDVRIYIPVISVLLVSVMATVLLSAVDAFSVGDARRPRVQHIIF